MNNTTINTTTCNEPTPSQFMLLLQKCCKGVIDGKLLPPGFETPENLAKSYTKNNPDKWQAAEALVQEQVVKSAVFGFMTSAPGITAIPLNMASSTALNLRMIAGIAAIAGYDLNDDRVQSLVVLTLAGESVDKLLRPMGISTAQALARAGINAIPRRVIGRINAKVGIKFLSKFSGKGVVQLGKLIPLAGGIFGGAVDGTVSKILGNLAIKNFLGKPEACRMAA